MIASLLSCLLLALPARAASTRVGADAAVEIPRLSPLSSPLSAPAPTLTETPSFLPISAPSFAPTPIVAAPLAAAVEKPSPLPSAAAQTVPAAPAVSAAAALSHPSNDKTAKSTVVRDENAALFDGALHSLITGESGDLALDGIGFDKNGDLHRRGVSAVPPLGRGTRGIVNAHPSVPGAVIKTISLSAAPVPAAARDMMDFVPLTPGEAAAKEEKTARALAAVDVGPRYFGRTELEGRQVSVRERVYGKTLDQLANKGAYGPEQHALVLAMIRRLAAAGISASDIRPPNVMIGRTAIDPQTRAYLVDGGSILELDASLDVDQRIGGILEQYIPTNMVFGLGSSLGRVLQKTLDRSAYAASGGLWGSIARFVGIGRAPQPPPRDEAERLDREFAKIDFWSTVGPAAKTEIESLRAQKLSKAEAKEYVRREVNAAFDRIKAARGTKNVGLHFNLHGGTREDYVGAGIHASKGDIALRYSMHADANDKVYFFKTEAHDAFTALDGSNGEIMFFPTRMGHALSVFAVDAPELKAAMADGRITDVNAISMDFHKGMRGVPYSAFLAPPVDVFIGTANKVGLKKLSRDEETLATARFLEAAVTAGGAYIPR